MTKGSHDYLQVAIDGPAGAGKSTVAKAVAHRLGLFYVDTGAMYRAIALKALRLSIPLDDADRISKLAQETEVVLDHSGEQLVWCDGEDVTEGIRSPHVSRVVSSVAANPGVRRRLVDLQRAEARRGGIVMDGRDIGTYVLPDAQLKVFLTASPEERARRRWLELSNQGKQIEFKDVFTDMVNRDRQDKEREFSPLEPAKNAIILDTTLLGIDEIVNEIVALAEGVRG